MSIVVPEITRRLIQVKILWRRTGDSELMEWQPVSTAPFERDLELAVIAADGVHVLVFACRRVSDGWINAATRKQSEVYPTHWREWHGGL